MKTFKDFISEAPRQLPPKQLPLPLKAKQYIPFFSPAHRPWRATYAGDLGVGEYEVTKDHKKHQQHTDTYPDDRMYYKITLSSLPISDNVVGDLEYNRDSGRVSGKLHGKDLPDISRYGGKISKSGPLSNLHKFLKSKAGIKWASNLVTRKYSKPNEKFGKSVGKHVKRKERQLKLKF